MKNLLTIPILFFWSLAHSQIDQIVKTTANAVADSVATSKIAILKSSMDTIIYCTVKTTPSFPTMTLDTLRCSVGEVMSFLIHVVSQAANGDGGGGWKEVIIKNTNGIYSIVSDRNILGYSGQNSVATPKAAINISIISNIVCLRVTASNNNVMWKSKRERNL